MTPEQLAAEQRAFLIRTEKQSAILLAAEFDALKREISDYLTATLPGEITLAKIEERNFLARFLDKLTEEIDILSSPLAVAVARAQKRVINFAADSLKRFLPEIRASIFETDKEAIRQLINRTQRGESLLKAFSRLSEPIALRTKQELIEGFREGETAANIAARINDVSDVGLTRAMTLARTETNEAYRAASRDFFRDADIKKYVWLSVLDVRTCSRCWFLHGKVFKTKHKVTSHPNCRCTLIPKQSNIEIVSGAERFAILNEGYQRQIIGSRRLEMYKQGVKFDSFFDSRQTEHYGEQIFIKPLADFSDYS